jgi:hypothetical protein
MAAGLISRVQVRRSWWLASREADFGEIGLQVK